MMTFHPWARVFPMVEMAGVSADRSYELFWGRVWLLGASIVDAMSTMVRVWSLYTVIFDQLSWTPNTV